MVIVGAEAIATSPWPDDERVTRSASAAEAVAFVDGLSAIADLGDRFHPEAVEYFVHAFEARPDAAAAYADCTELTEAGSLPVLRPAWNPDLALSTRYTGDPFVVTADTLRTVQAAGWTPGLDEFSRHDLMLRVSERPCPVLHIPAGLCYRSDPLPAATKAAVAAAQASLKRSGRASWSCAAAAVVPGAAELLPAFDSHPAASIVIPTAAAPGADGRPLIERCLDSLAATDWPNTETILVAGDECRLSPAELAALAGAAHPEARVVRRPRGPFNFSEAVNCGALAARGTLLLLLNDDTEVTDPGWLARMAVHAMAEGVGAVGARLLFADGTIQHTGLLVDDGRWFHPFAGWVPDEADRRGWGTARTVCAVTGACLMTRRSDFLALGGLSPLLPLTFNDVDYCLRLAEAGLRTVVEPAATLVHHESSTRPPVMEAWEQNRFDSRWGQVIDPWYHPGYVRPRDPAAPRRDADHMLPSAAPAIRTPRTSEVRREFNRVHSVRPRPLAATRTAGWPRLLRRARRAASRADTVANMPIPKIDAELTPSGRADPVASNDPDVLRREVLRLRDALAGAHAMNVPLRARVVELEKIEADRTRCERLFGNPVVRSAIAATRPVRRLLPGR